MWSCSHDDHWLRRCAHTGRFLLRRKSRRADESPVAQNLPCWNNISIAIAHYNLHYIASHYRSGKGKQATLVKRAQTETHIQRDYNLHVTRQKSLEEEPQGENQFCLLLLLLSAQDPPINHQPPWSSKPPPGSPPPSLPPQPILSHGGAYAAPGAFWTAYVSCFYFGQHG